jgi:carbonic anhydrase
LAALALAAATPVLAVEGGYPASGQPAETPARAGGHGHGAQGGSVTRTANPAHAPAKGHKAGKAGHARARGHKAAAHKAHAHVHIEPAKPGDLAPAEALDRLMAGNKRFLTAAFIHPEKLIERRAELAKGQRPFAVILGCADSRVPPEFVFDQGLGDLFVVRVAGNVADPHVLGSIEYAVEHLGSPLIVVLGHERCGAVSAAVKGGDPGGSIGSLVEAIEPAVQQAKRSHPPDADALLDRSVKANVHMVAGELARRSPILAAFVKAKRLEIKGARYDLDTGVVDLVP